MLNLPACCYPSEDATVPERMYCAYNAGGERPGLNYRGDPCPMWADLPDDIKAKWKAAFDYDMCGKTTGLTLGEAILFARLFGRRIQRAGWNGKQMWVAYTPGTTIPLEAARAGAARLLVDEIDGGNVADTVRICGHLDMRAADGSLVIGWLASQTDMLAEDWSVLP